VFTHFVGQFTPTAADLGPNGISPRGISFWGISVC
jgi:hypothetical protein